MSQRPEREDFRLGEVRVRPARLVLEIDGEERRVEPRVMETLVFLAAHAGETVSRETLRDELWDAYVTDDAIQRGVWKLRRALGAHAAIVVTVPKRGYRLTLPPHPIVEAAAAEVRAAAARDRVGARRAIQVVGMGATLSLVATALWLALGDAPLPARGNLPAADASDLEFVPLSAMAGYETQPDVDPRGTLMVFAHFPKEGEGAFQWDLWERSIAEDDAPRRLTATPEHEMAPALAPDGARVAFVRMDAGGGCDFWVLDRATGVAQPTGVDCGVSRDPADCCRVVAWRDGEHLLVNRRESVDAPLRVFEVDLVSGVSRILTDPPAQSEGDTGFALAPDGRTLALVRNRSAAAADLFLQELDGGTPRRLTAAGYPISGVDWSADGRSVVFGWMRTGTAALWEVAAAGGAPRPLRTVGMNASGPALSDEALIYEEWKSEINLVRVELAGGAVERVAHSTHWEWRGVGAPSGDRIAFVTNRGGGQELWLVAGGGGEPRRLASFGGPIASAPAWSPDGARLALSVAAESGLDLVAVDVESGAVEPLVRDASDELAPVFSPDGAALLFVSNRSGRAEVHALDLATGGVRRWTREGGAAARPTLAGEGIWFVRPGTPGLWRQRAADAAPELVAPTFRPSAPSDWTVVEAPGGEAIWFVRHDADFTAWLSRLDVATGSTDDLLRLDAASGVPEPYTGGGLWVEPGGRSVLLSSVDASHSDLWLRQRRR